jgi:hypothetical protein
MLISNAPIVVPVSTANPPTELVQAETAKKVPVPAPKSTVENPTNRQVADSYQDNKNNAEEAQKNEQGDSKESVSEREEATQDQQSNQSSKQEKQQELIEQKEIQQLKKRDAEVKAHEQAHATVGGALAGAPQYQYTVGPDGKRYAIAGEVKIDISPEQDPQQTITKMEKVKRAALAPVEPSPQDLKVAAEAGQIANQALAELAVQRSQEAKLEQAEKPLQASEKKSSVNPVTARRVSEALADKINHSGALGILKKPATISITS